MYNPKGDNVIKLRLNISVKFFSLILLALLFSGCIYLKGRTMEDPEEKDLKMGELAFIKGEFVSASDIFKRVLKKSVNKEKKNKARYGLICIGLATAENPDEVKVAMENMVLFFKNNPGAENLKPGILISCFKNIIKISENEITKHIKRNKVFRDNLSKRKKKIKTLNETIKTLKYQISELQNIDQKLQEIQEKRKTN